MDYRRQYMIPFGGLKLGNHSFDFEIDKKFFEEFEYSEYKSGQLTVKVEMEKQQRMLILNFYIIGTLDVVCDRCLDIFPFEISGKYQLFVKFGSENMEESDDVIVINENETRLNVGHLIYEYIVLSVPIRHVHPDNSGGQVGCDPEVIQKLQEVKLKENIDPRWDALRKLKS